MLKNGLKTEKPLCIMDTNTLLNSYKIELAGHLLIQWIRDLRSIIIPESVEKELKERLEGHQYNDIFTKYLNQGQVCRTPLKNCKESIKKWFCLNNKIQQYKKLSDADLDCVALALLESRNVKNLVILSTDELNLKDELNNFLIEQKAGLLLTTPDMIIYFYSIYTQISEDQVISAFQDFKRLGYINIEPNNYLEKNCRYMSLCIQECIR